MTIEVIAVALVVFAPALLFLGWLTVIGALVSALGTTADRDLDELRLLRPASRPS
jgi:hypothetical protein